MVRNTGVSALSLSGDVQVPEGFAIVYYPETSIEPGESDVLIVQLVANAGGEYHGELRIPSNDADEYSFPTACG